MTTKTMFRSAALLVFVFVVLAIIGNTITSAPSEAVADSGRQPTTTTTTEPPPEGVAFVTIENGAFRPAILKLDLTTTQIVRWTNEDDAEYLLTSTTQAWEPVTLAKGDQFEFDFSTLEPGINRYNATIGFQRIPGSVDTRPDQ